MYPLRNPQARQNKAIPQKWIAPTAGWVSNRALAAPDGTGAEVLDNFFARSSGVVLRRGSELYATLVEDSLPASSLFTYKNGENEQFFAANENSIYDISDIQFPANQVISSSDEDLISDGTDAIGWYSTADYQVATGYTGGEWSTVQFSTAGGVFLVGVNGEDAGFLYNGTTFASLAITFDDGAGNTYTTADMSFVWSYRNRLWFIQKGTLNAWYMKDVAVIAGVAEIFPMGGIFSDGGALMFGARWSLEGGIGGGLSDQNVFCTNQGQNAIYQGGNPSEASDWTLVGIYRTGTPLGKRAYLRGGGDLAICTTVGLVPLSKAIQLDVTALNTATISYTIADAWSDAVNLRGNTGWQAMIWAEEKMAFVCPPDIEGAGEPAIFVSNTETGAWSRFTGTRVYSLAIYKGQLYVGSTNGRVIKYYIGGSDLGSPYTGVCIPMFSDAGTPAMRKVAKNIIATTRSREPINDRVDMLFDFNSRTPPAPDASIVAASNTWGSAIWGISQWSDTTPTHIQNNWRSAGGMGYTFSPCYQITSGSTAPLDVELIEINTTHTVAGLVS